MKLGLVTSQTCRTEEPLVVFFFSYVPQVKRDKLDKKVEPRIIIGYSDS